MHKLVQLFKTHLPFPDIYPPHFHNILNKEHRRDMFLFRNLPHFCHVVSKLKQEKDDHCGVTYQKAVQMLINGESDLKTKDAEKIRNKVRQNLYKRGLITEETYEEYKYSVDGTVVGYDVAKYAAGEPDCVITPARHYIDYFYEVYVNGSYPYWVPDKQVRKSCAKLCATIEELERQHIFIKVTTIIPIREVNKGYNRDLFVEVPLFSHKDPKNAQKMTAVINDRLLRKFIFALMEDYYGDELNDHKGYANTVEHAMNIGEEFNEVKFFEDVLQAVGA